MESNFFSVSNMGMWNMFSIWVFTRFHDNQNTNTHMWVHCFAVMEMEKGKEAGRKRAGRERKGETIGHPGRFFNQVITVIRCKANVKSLNEIPMRRENTMRIHNWQAISYFYTLGTDLRRSWFCQNTAFILFKEIITLLVRSWRIQIDLYANYPDKHKSLHVRNVFFLLKHIENLCSSKDTYSFSFI